MDPCPTYMQTVTTYLLVILPCQAESASRIMIHVAPVASVAPCCALLHVVPCYISKEALCMPAVLYYYVGS